MRNALCPAMVYSTAGLVALVLSGCDQSTRVSAPVVAPATSQAVADDLPSDAELKAKLDDAIAFTAERRLDPKVQSAWQVVHGIMALGRELKFEQDGQLVPALDYLLEGGAMKGWNFMPGEKGLDSLLEEGTKTGQGHEDQWLGYLSQCGLKPDEKLVVKGETYTVADLLSQAQWDVRDGMEATWTLMAFSTYLPLDATWQARDGSTWSIERLVAMEAAQDLATSACGGTHRLYGLATALARRRAEGLPVTGGWQAAEEKIRWAIDGAQAYQQPDGGFSTQYIHRSATAPDVALRINTTGHVLEFLAMAMTDEELRQPWVARAAVFLCDMFELTRKQDLECGGLYHAAHGLKLYRDRRFGAATAGEGQ